jgi:hypothetical protein
LRRHSARGGSSLEGRVCIDTAHLLDHLRGEWCRVVVPRRSTRVTGVVGQDTSVTRCSFTGPIVTGYPYIAPVSAAYLAATGPPGSARGRDRRGKLRPHAEAKRCGCFSRLAGCTRPLWRVERYRSPRLAAWRVQLDHFEFGGAAAHGLAGVIGKEGDGPASKQLHAHRSVNDLVVGDG